MTTHTPGPEYTMPQPPFDGPTEPMKPPKRKRTVPLFVAILGALGVGLVSCVAGNATGGGTPKAAPAPAASTVTKVVQAPAPAASTVTITKEAAPPAPKDKIEDGTWTVGTDFPAGIYRTVGAGTDCYWSITKSGSNGQDIINNHIGGGNLTVTLKQGQDFTSNRCGTWGKVG